MKIRKMNLNDLESILKIEESLYLSPWNKTAFLSDLDNKYSFNFVLEDMSKIIGYYGVWIVDDFATVTKVSIAKEYQGKHLSNVLMDDLIELCNKQNCSIIDLEVRESNTIAINLYKKYGFKLIRKIKNYYTNEDGLNMNKLLKEGEGYEKVFVSSRK